jgi:hypothetical protein
MKLLLVSATLFISLISLSQSAIDKLYLDLSGGARFMGNTTSSTKAAPGMHMDLGLGYQLNDNFAVKGELAFDQYIAKDTAADAVFSYDSGIKYAYLYDKSTLIRVSINGVLNIGAMAGFATEKFGMKAQIGVGVASNNNSNFKADYSGTFADPGIKGNDDMISAGIVLTPQYLINSRIALNGNIGYTFLAKQSNYVDRVVDGTQVDGTDMLLHLSVGVSAKLGK